MLQRIRSFGQKAAVLFLTSAPVLALAQTTDPFQLAVDNATDKIEIYAAALVGVAAVGVVFMIAMKYVKKIRGAA